MKKILRHSLYVVSQNMFIENIVSKYIELYNHYHNSVLEYLHQPWKILSTRSEKEAGIKSLSFKKYLSSAL